jgi:hypothetical protein
MKPTNTIIALVISSFSITVSAQDTLATDTFIQNENYFVMCVTVPHGKILENGMNIMQLQEHSHM